MYGGVAHVTHIHGVYNKADAGHEHVEHIQPLYASGPLQFAAREEQGQNYDDEADSEHEEEHYTEDFVEDFDEFGQVVVQGTNCVQSHQWRFLFQNNVNIGGVVSDQDVQTFIQDFEPVAQHQY